MERPERRRSYPVAGAVLGGVLWGAALYIGLYLDPSQSEDPLSPRRAVQIVLALAAGALTFFPIGARVKSRVYGPIATLAWTGLIVQVTQVQVGPDGTAGNAGPVAWLLIMVALATATALMPVAHEFAPAQGPATAWRRGTLVGVWAAFVLGLQIWSRPDLLAVGGGIVAALVVELAAQWVARRAARTGLAPGGSRGMHATDYNRRSGPDRDLVGPRPAPSGRRTAARRTGSGPRVRPGERATARGRAPGRDR